ncbi:MAG: bifunctional DNA primase/polymerase [Caulobacter sp.]|nr:bifunctional DNA primase/polymerase [Caulobacter sp.]
MNKTTPPNIPTPGLRALKGRASETDEAEAPDAQSYVPADREQADQSRPSCPDAAHYYATRFGLAVFPAAVQPFRPLVAGGCHAATIDPEQIAAWWRDAPDAGVAVATGAKSGVIVLDVDVKNGIDGTDTLDRLMQEHGALDPTWLSITPSGGRHYWFRDSGLGLSNRVAFLPGLDLRSDGGAVAVPPSGAADRNYRWVIQPGAVDLIAPPAWLLDRLVKPDRLLSRAQPLLRFETTGQRVAYISKVLQSEGEKVACAAPGMRNNLLFLASCNVGRFIPALLTVEIAESVLLAAAETCGLIAEDRERGVLATIRSGLRRGMQSPREIS